MSSGLQSDPAHDPARLYCTGSIAPIPFVHSSCLEDFRVEELPEGQPEAGQEDWTHVWFEIEKRGLSTAQAVGRVARALGREAREVGYAGRKDAMGVTRQFLSLEHVDAAAVQGLELKDLRVLATGRRSRKLRVGELAGNRFDLTLRDLPPERHEDLERALSQLSREGLPNFYGPQRFGAGGVTRRLGNLLVRGDWRGYLRAFVHSHQGPGEVREPSPVASLLMALDSDQRKDWRAARSLSADLPASLVPLAKQMARRPLDLASLVRTLPRRTKALHVSALQAAVFNRVLGQRMIEPGGARRVLPGDLLVDPWTGEGMPAPEGDGAAEAQVQSDLLRRVPSGPLPGPAAQRTRGTVAEWEREALAQADLDLEALASLPGALAPKGARRALLVGPRDVTWEAEGAVVRLRFTLPPGAYATVLLEELGKPAGVSQSETQ
ncbi:MAG TPA: tRNA pseudouridine(13) synthase TruD [Planctomycetes bacterium]|nr:tRNA pseudouridine(13) synthase TruD [Planctomycetota bacterium]HIK61312.1 tRNA pseudouridine(13) synthase TruD [Planctomycetota bacterium]